MNNNNIYDPMFLAGLAVMQGAPFSEALNQAAMTTYNLQQSQAAQQEQQRTQALSQQLPRLLRETDTQDPYALFNTLIQNGIAPNEAALIVERLRGPQNSMVNKANTFSGPGGIKFESFTNPETGRLESREIPGQREAINVRPLSVSELRINSTKLKDLDNDARNAEKELRLLEDSEEAFRDFDKSAGVESWTGAGSIVSKYVPKGVDNIFYNKNAQGAKQKIDKLNSQLFQNRVAILGARGTDAAKKEIIKGLPSIELTPEARRDVLDTKKREGYEQVLRSKFFNEWSKRNNKDLNGAEVAFGELLNSESLISAEGKLNKNLLKNIPSIVNEYVSESTSFLPTENSSEEQVEDIYAQFEELPLAALEAEKARRRGGR